MGEGDENFQRVADMFLKQYKNLLVERFREGGDNHRFQRLIQNNSFARDLYDKANRFSTIYENASWQSSVLETLDLDLIYANVDAMPRESEEQYPDNLVKELLRYFKQDFFKWCNKPDCDSCGPGTSEQQEPMGTVGPNNDEARYECSVVELYRHNVCGTVTRFPRYNNPIKLLETRLGRCGEWCNVFTLILRSFGLEARYVWNREDHVWCEYYSKYLKRWVHVDSCEQSFDQPYIYSVNWNKKMSYCIAFNKDTMIDVSKRYILKNQLPRDQISEDDLKFLCNFVTRKLRSQLSDKDIYDLACQDSLEELGYFPTKTDAKKAIKTQAQGRESGSADWKGERGEDGS
ncbi:hypothetical protein HG535_0H02740 [Zygotorulaspora mrakii]|uniref:Peptide-N(4)-(N-acetyl-beta-glucosaminyl)asparagine amidase n=1 Tax=Zygotorulaspora mrakii TaxID=42260 RepID=A0A7H9B8K8_ZYGMR|nr:uncharacterized protein HG535_0H02740 [Zygotorulaspora mrakii]QLG74947.1 hypothetical protein HG535_0H02740 [Zygotorulaspora mrakii]